MKTKRELRQEAVERLKNLGPTVITVFEIVDAVRGSDAYHDSYCKVREQIINLLEDDGPTEDDYLELLRDAAREYRFAHAELESTRAYSKGLSEYVNCDTIALPVDAKGEIIHIDDVMKCFDGAVFTVKRLEYCNRGEWMLCGPLVGEAVSYRLFSPSSCHHHEPTVEDVLTEFVTKLDERGHLSNGVAMTVAEYAEKLQLREAE